VEKLLKFGIPKGSLQEATLSLLKKAGWNISIGNRSYFPEINDDMMSCALCRAQEMSPNVANGTLDVGLTGKDWIAEHQSDVEVITDLVYSKVSARPARWVLATSYVSPVPFETINAAIDKGKGKPHMTPVKNTMENAENVAKAMLIAPLAGVVAAAGKWYSKQNKKDEE